jgi:hypothetical protein
VDDLAKMIQPTRSPAHHHSLGGHSEKSISNNKNHIPTVSSKEKIMPLKKL